MSRNARMKILIAVTGCILSIYILAKVTALSADKTTGLAITLNYLLLLFALFWCSRREK